MYLVTNERPQAASRPTHPQPGRLSTRERLQVSAKVRALEADWLFQAVGPEGKRRLLQEHGLIPR